MPARQKLQEKMEGILHDPRNAGIEHRPEELKDKAFDSHSGAYLEAGLPELGIWDAVPIGNTPEYKEFKDSRTWKEFWEVAGPYSARKVDDAVKRRMENLEGSTVD
jgi:hypothetical protein